MENLSKDIQNKIDSLLSINLNNKLNKIIFLIESEELLNKNFKNQDIQPTIIYKEEIDKEYDCDISNKMIDKYENVFDSYKKDNKKEDLLECCFLNNLFEIENIINYYKNSIKKSYKNIKDDLINSFSFKNRSLYNSYMSCLLTNDIIYFSYKYSQQNSNNKENKHQRYYKLKNDYNSKMFILKFTNEFIKEMDCHLLGDETLNALKDLWCYQFKAEQSEKNNQIDVSYELTFLKDIKENLKTLLFDLYDSYSSHNEISRLKFKEFLNFYLEVQNKKITSQSNVFQSWIFEKEQDKKSKTTEMNSLLQLYDDSIIDKMNQVKLLNEDEEEYKEIIKELKKDSRCEDYNYKIFKLNYNKPDIDYKQYNKKVPGIHGTKTISVLPILANGFRRNDDLMKDKDAKYAYTASGLGDGVYFARPYQCGKSMNYVGRTNKYGFMFLSDIYYHKMGSTKTYINTNNFKTDCDLILGDKVGSGGIDELLVRKAENIHLKYLILFEKN